MFTAQGSNRRARLRLFQNRHDLTVSKFRCFHAESPALILKRKFYFYFLLFFRGITYTSQPIFQLFEYKLSELTEDVFCDWLDHNDFRPTTSAKAYRLTRAFLNWCEEHEDYENLVPPKSYNSKKLKIRSLPQSQE
jgi:hypothetical protein